MSRNIQRLFKFLILLPYFYLFTALAIIDKGDKKMVIGSLIAIVASVAYYRWETIKSNRKNPALLVVAAMTLYVVGKDIFMDSSPSMLRSYLVAVLLMLFFPLQLLTTRLLSWLSFAASVVLFSNTLYYGQLTIRDTGLLNAIPYATICAAIATLGLFLFLYTRKILPLMTFILATTCVVLSQTRGLWLALLCAMVILAIFYLKNNKQNRKILLISAVVIVVIVAASALMKDTIYKRVENTQVEFSRIASGDYSSSIGLRFQMWDAALKIAQHNLWFGVGSEHKQILQELVQQGELRPSIGKFHPDHYHNQFFENLAKMGIVGLVLTLMLFIVPAMHALKHRQQPGSGLLLALVCLYFVACLTDVPFWYAETNLLYLLLIIPLCSKTHQLFSDSGKKA
ncbi:O-antigen ligase family protein [Methylophaga sp.]|uniref:O-antigen ligase family protein n=1 Tax=Methylophaga sp. TaxID=2024840 RepID=UPI003A8F807B